MTCIFPSVLVLHDLIKVLIFGSMELSTCEFLCLLKALLKELSDKYRKGSVLTFTFFSGINVAKADKIEQAIIPNIKAQMFIKSHSGFLSLSQVK